LVPEQLITSAANPTVKRARRLRNRRLRDAEGVFLVEGIAHVRQAIDAGATIDSLLVAPELLTSEGALAAVAAEEARGTAVVRLGRAAFESIVERDHPSGLLGIVRMGAGELADLVAEPRSTFVALHDVGNPGNLGSIIRTVDAVGGSGVVVVGESTDHYHPAAVKASMGTLFSVPVRRAASFEELVAWCSSEQLTMIGTSAHATTDVWTATYPAPSVVIFGSEATGLPPEVLARCAMTVRIPMAGAASSLNLAVAAGVVLYEMRRRDITADR